MNQIAILQMAVPAPVFTGKIGIDFMIFWYIILRFSAKLVYGFLIYYRLFNLYDRKQSFKVNYIFIQLRLLRLSISSRRLMHLLLYPPRVVA